MTNVTINASFLKIPLFAELSCNEINAASNVGSYVTSSSEYDGGATMMGGLDSS